ncbi:Crp/Fnr family transcriptional regulator [Variovorax sp. J22R133]|uniref:Crp/Fnr family transcriptional regulator n=1 Tax=Variovorax brevis TaxID=3053503 RepID=UPI0025760DE7|nr:Crp/Fnr family transcriptional regulator [Variovorax sp. J22R133]MDM0114794.1 Crp/Fnr family transcriptional regulator [Variovorax sp. J22R133]
MTSQLLAAIETIQRVSWFADLDPVVVERLAEHCRPCHLRTGEALARRGDPQTQMYFVRSGSLEIGIHGRDGKRHVTRCLMPGEVYGLIPALDGGGAVHDAQAHEPTELLQLSGEVLLSELQTQPSLALRLLHLLCGRSRQLYEMFAFQQLLSLHARVVHLIMILANVESQQHAAAQRDIEILMTQSELSDMLGVSRQSLSVELKKLEHQALIRIAHAKVVVVDPGGLARHASALI